MVLPVRALRIHRCARAPGTGNYGPGDGGDGEKPVPGAGILLNGSNAPGVTDAGGDLFVPNLAPHRRLDVSLATSTLDELVAGELAEGLRAAGFGEVLLYGGYDRSPFHPDDSGDLLVVARKDEPG